MNLDEIKERYERQYRSLDQEFGVVLDLDAVWRDIGDLIDRVEKLERVAEAAKEYHDPRTDVVSNLPEWQCPLCAALAALEADDE